ncbi:MAG: DUF4956 domain-containing protein [Acidobacteria bacterium]|nr:DUF4956 domain-containing protein [Acidobacteriota bacterium]
MPELDWNIPIRVAVAILYGAAVAWIHQRTSKPADASPSLQATLVLLAGLIAMVTQVIGDNVARAFSLVGALSIVRFRTVVRDTRDTAFVIFAVVAGMAAGSQAYWLGAAGMIIVGGAAFAMANRKTIVEPVEGEEFSLRIRAGLAVDVEASISDIAKLHCAARTLTSVATSKQGGALDYTYAVTPSTDAVPEELVKKLNRIEGVQEVRWIRRGQEAE